MVGNLYLWRHNRKWTNNTTVYYRCTNIAVLKITNQFPAATSPLHTLDLNTLGAVVASKWKLIWDWRNFIMPMAGGGNLIHSQLLTLHVLSLITVVWKVLAFHTSYSCFGSSCFAYYRPKSGASPTRKKKEVYVTFWIWITIKYITISQHYYNTYRH